MTASRSPAPDVVARREHDALARLRADGQRLTGPRRAVVRALAGLDGHPSAEEVGAQVALLDPSVHRATVYRTLDTLCELGLVSHVHSHGTTAYHLADEGDHDEQHLHARCRVCDRVVDLPAGLLDDVVAEVAQAQGFRIEPGHVALSGTCRSCAG